VIHWVPRRIIARYANLREPTPDRPRLGLSEREAVLNVRPHGNVFEVGLKVGPRRLHGRPHDSTGR
jgi:hypothetical protein